MIKQWHIIREKWLDNRNCYAILYPFSYSTCSPPFNPLILLLTIIDNDSQILNDLNNTITNNTRKEYITLWINYMEVSKKSYLELKNVTNLIKTYNDKNTTLSDVMDKIKNSYKLMDGYDKETNSIMEKIKEYDDKYPIVLINGTTPVYSLDKNITNESSEGYAEIDEPKNESAERS